MKAMKWMAAAVLLAASSGAALAQAPQQGSMLTTGALAELCGVAPSNPNAALATGFCRGFVVGAGQHHHATAGGRRAFCIPEPGPTAEEFQAAFVAWVRANPANANDRAVDGLTRFAAATWPCPAPAAQPRRR
jgi:hypothetical protein